MRSPKSHTHNVVRIGSRGSPLARLQVEEVLRLLKKKGIRFSCQFQYFETRGDKDKKTPLSTNPADDFFTDELDAALVSGEIDLAVHSAKDLPQELRPQLILFALTPSLDDTDAFVGKGRLADLPKGARVGASSASRQQAVRAVNPRVQVVDVRGTIEERLSQLDQGKIDGLIVATCALKRLGLQKRIKEIMTWEATPLQGQLAVVGRRVDLDLQKKVSAIDVRQRYGPVHLVGAGPGDPGLITLKGVQILHKADCVFYDYLIDQKLLRHAPDAQKIYVGKRKGAHTLPQAVLSRMLKEKAMAGQTVVRLKGGDPLVFGRGADEISYLRAYHIDVQVIPGVSSATGIPSLLGIPLTERGVASSVAFVSGHGEAEKDSAPQSIKVPSADTLIFLMGLSKIQPIVRSLREAKWGKDTPVAVISRGTTADERVVLGTLADIEGKVRDGKLEPPALIIVGETVRFALPLFPTRWKAVPTSPPSRRFSDHRILYLGTHPEKYQTLGRIVHLPMIEISGLDIKPSQARTILKKLRQADLIVLTSPHAVRYFFEFLGKNRYPKQNLRTVEFAVVGRETSAALLAEGFTARTVAAVETAEGLWDELNRRYALKAKTIIFPRSALPNPFLRTQLQRAGAQVLEFAVYRNTKPRRRSIFTQAIDSVLFSSPSTVINFLKDYGKIPAGWQVLCKGPLTQRALKKAGYRSELVAI